MIGTNKVLVENLKKIAIYNNETSIMFHIKDFFDGLLFLKNNILCQFKILSCISGVDFLVNNYRLRLVFDNVSLGVEKYFFIAVLFAFSLSSNVIDLISYSFTVTSHLFLLYFSRRLSENNIIINEYFFIIMLVTE